jgi:RimJ/RimL family protein N-acetyltransferase
MINSIHSAEHFSTLRLDLYLISPKELIELRSHPAPADIFANRVFKNPLGVLTTENLPRENRIRDVEANPANIKWYYRLIVLRETQVVIGSISFHAPPDDSGMLEVGFGIHESYRNLGYGKEALIEMFRWACNQPEVTTLRYTVAQTNAPSQAIIKKLNFEYKGIQIDDEDGPEDIFELSAQEFARLYRAMR